MIRYECLQCVQVYASFADFMAAHAGAVHPYQAVDDEPLPACPDCGTTTAPNHSGDHHERACLLYAPPSPFDHPSWCRCQRVCGGDQ